MSSTRSIIASPPFAANALTVIPPTPVAGVSYRDPAAGPASSPDGWPYAERVNSAEFNQIMYQSTSLLSILDKKGVLGWANLVDYTEAAITLGSDGTLYEWLQASGPANGGAKDPVSQPTFWRRVRSGTLISIRPFLTAGATVYTETPGTKSVYVKLQGGGGAGGGAPVTGATSVSFGNGGGGGSYGEGFYTSAFSGVTITIGAGGTPTALNGGAGGNSSFGALMVCPGGGGGAGRGAAVPPIGIGGAAPAGTPPTGANVLSAVGSPGAPGFAAATALVVPGLGGATPCGGPGAFNSVGVQPGAAFSRGAGGTGAWQQPSGTAVVGGQGADGGCWVFEYA